MFREGMFIFGMYCDKSKVSLYFIKYWKIMFILWYDNYWLEFVFKWMVLII